MKTIFNYISFSLLFIVSCTSAQQPDFQSDLFERELPAGTQKVVEKTMIYKYATDEIKPRQETNYTFNKDGNYETITIDYGNDHTSDQIYTYNENGDLIKHSMLDSNVRVPTITTYHITGTNPQTIDVSVQNGQVFIPKIVKYFDGKNLSKKEIYNNAGTLREVEEYFDNKLIHRRYSNSGELLFTYQKDLKDGRVVKEVRFDKFNKIMDGTEYELNESGGYERSYKLSPVLKREKEGNGYYYLVKDGTWVLRVQRNIRDYGSGRTANITLRDIKGNVNASVTEDEVKKFMVGLE